MDNIFNLVQDGYRKRLINNCYSYVTFDNIKNIWKKEDSFLFSYVDHGIDRLVFFIDKIDTLMELLLCVKEEAYIEIITRTPEEYNLKGELIARMKRLANPDCSSVFSSGSPVVKYANQTIGEYAEEKDVPEINHILWTTFNTEISHLLTDKELLEIVRAKGLTVHKTAEVIDALLQVEVMPKKFYINQIINRTDSNIIHGLLLNRLSEYIENGGKYLYAWVEENNMASVKFHEKYGMKHDGMWSLIYRIGGQL